MVVEQRGGGDIHYTSQPIDSRFHVRLPVAASIDGEAPSIVVRLGEVG